MTLGLKETKLSIVFLCSFIFKQSLQFFSFLIFISFIVLLIISHEMRVCVCSPD